MLSESNVRHRVEQQKNWCLKFVSSMTFVIDTTKAGQWCNDQQLKFQPIFNINPSHCKSYYNSIYCPHGSMKCNNTWTQSFSEIFSVLIENANRQATYTEGAAMTILTHTLSLIRFISIYLCNLIFSLSNVFKLPLSPFPALSLRSSLHVALFVLLEEAPLLLLPFFQRLDVVQIGLVRPQRPPLEGRISWELEN